MSFNITIGDGIVTQDTSDFPNLYVCWNVIETKHPDAPASINDFSKYSNNRTVDCKEWFRFCNIVEIREVFYDEHGYLITDNSSSTVGITADMLNKVSLALEKYRSKLNENVIPGFIPNDDDHDEFYDLQDKMGVPLHTYEEPIEVDQNLALLIWVEWWMRWAVKHCKVPAIYIY